jgi:two-component system sensor histidine kinase PhoQ
MPSSLSGRLLIAVSLLLTLFFGITIVLLDSAFRRSAESAIRDRLDVQLIVLLAGAEPDAGNGVLSIPQALPEARFETPGSGLYGQINNDQGALLWRSPSAVGAALTDVPRLAPGERRFERALTPNGEPVFALSLGVAWEFADGALGGFVFTAAEHLAPYRREVAGFRNALFGWFALLTVLLLSAMAVLLRALLQPLRRVEEEIVDVEQGRAGELGQDYPRELQGVTANLNALLDGERSRLARYRDTLGNLAHSLKTPLAVMRNAIGTEPRSAQSEVLNEQLEHMQDMVSYQLQRAAAWGATTLGHKPVAVAPVVNRIGDSLAKVHADKPVVLEVSIPEEATFYGDEGDLMEVLGNLMDNAWKWCERRVQVRVRQIEVPDKRRAALEVQVDDDGPGIDPRQAARLTERGTRADELVDGHGIGLNIVRELVNLYGGVLQIERGALGGACICVRFDAS